MLANRLRRWYSIGSMSRLHYCHCMNPQQTRYADTMLDRCGRLWITIEPPVGPAVWCTGGMAVMWLLSLRLFLLSGVLAVWSSCDCWASSWSCCLVYWRHDRHVIVEPPVGPAVWCIGGMTVMWLLSLQLVLLSGVLAVWPSCDCCIKSKWVSEGIVLNPSTAGTDYIRFFYSFKFLLPHCISAFKQVKDIKWHKSAVI